MRITYDKSIELDNFAVIEKHLTPFLWLVPKWVQEFSVFVYTDDSDGAYADITSEYDYRRVALNIYGKFFILNGFERERTIVHELCHIYLQPVISYARNSFDDVCPKSEAPQLNQVLSRELTVRMESATQDLAFAVMSKFNEQSIEN